MDSSSSQADPILLLIDKLRTEKGPGRVEVLRQLQELNPVPQEVMSELIRVLKDQDPVVRLEAAMFFEDVGPSAVPMLVEALQGGEVELPGGGSDPGHYGTRCPSRCPRSQKSSTG
jgi:hypothetical protein